MSKTNNSAAIWYNEIIYDLRTNKDRTVGQLINGLQGATQLLTDHAENDLNKTILLYVNRGLEEVFSDYPSEYLVCELPLGEGTDLNKRIKNVFIEAFN
jgi:predicted aconitase